MKLSQLYDRYSDYDTACDAIAYFIFDNKEDDNMFVGDNLYKQRVYKLRQDCDLFFGHVSRYLWEDEFYITDIVGRYLEGDITNDEQDELDDYVKSLNKELENFMEKV